MVQNSVSSEDGSGVKPSFYRAVSSQQLTCERAYCRDALTIIFTIYQDAFFELSSSDLSKIGKKLLAVSLAGMISWFTIPTLPKNGKSNAFFLDFTKCDFFS